MKTKIQAIAGQLKTAILRNPAEVLLSLTFFVLGCIYAYDLSLPVEFILVYFPAFFFITYALNYTTENKRIRFIYYLSTLLFIPFIGYDKFYYTPVYPITIIISQLVYLVSRRQINNTLFIRESLRYLKALFSAFLLACIACLVTLSIYFSISYIFEIWQTRTGETVSCISFFAFILILPLLFLMFDNKKEEHQTYNKLFDVLLNYVLSPALIIYAAILYLYFIKITLQWSLPKGGIAYIVVSFITAVFILRGCQPFLRRRYYDWFYKYASITVLPALVMYWIGAYYRINQYGFTELRVYLVITGVILTVMTFIFFSKQWGRYLYVAYITIILLSAVTYIPGMSAKNIEHYSQEYRKRKGIGNPENPTRSFSSYYIESAAPINIEDFTTVIPVSFYRRKGEAFWINYIHMQPDDSIYFYSPEDEVIFADNVQSFFNKQLTKAGIQLGDSIPGSEFARLLQYDMDSAMLVFRDISVSRDTLGKPYKVDYLTPYIYLKK